LQISFEIKDKNLIVNFNGELDHHSAEEIRKEIDNSYLEKMLKNVIFDLKNLRFMDSSGIGIIMGRYKLTSENGGKVILVNVSSRVEKILSMSGILKIVKVSKNLTEAIENL